MCTVVIGAGYVVKQALSQDYLGYTVTIGLVLGGIALIEKGLSHRMFHWETNYTGTKTLCSFTLTVITGLTIGAFGAGMLSTASTAAAIWVII